MDWERLTGSLAAIKARAPVVGKLWCMGWNVFKFRLFSKSYRQKEDPWNAILSGFMTGVEYCSQDCLLKKIDQSLPQYIEPIAAPDTTNVVTSLML
ncbi:hypothetical protein H4Q26_014484 [Puccinia striiformis f. sp. tritici PST-130]|nr:hypothetical protein H4Q26_014484 [Puccinia striiformis f. sp. tritici PST-130]